MAKVVVTADTVAKTLEVTVDGDVLDDVRDLHFFYDDDAASDNPYRLQFELCTMDADTENGLRTYTRYCASEKPKNPPKFSKDLDFVSKQSSIDKEISELLSRKS